MAKAFAIALILAVVFAGSGGLLILAHSEPSTDAIDSDLADVQAQIVVSDNEIAKYEGGAIKLVAELRRELLRSSEAMLRQKRASLVRRIELQYVVNGKPLAPPSESRLNEIESELDKANSALANDEAKAEQYSGGLLQVMSLMTAATDRLTIAQLRLAYYGAKYGIAVPLGVKPEQMDQPSKMSPGSVVKDKDAL